MAEFSFYTAGMAFWVLSLALLIAGFAVFPMYVIQSVVLTLTAVTNFILGGLSIIYAELMKSAE